MAALHCSTDQSALQWYAGYYCALRAVFVIIHSSSDLDNMSKLCSNSCKVTEYTILSEQHTLARPYCLWSQENTSACKNRQNILGLQDMTYYEKQKTGPAEHDFNFLNYRKLVAWTNKNSLITVMFVSQPQVAETRVCKESFVSDRRFTVAGHRNHSVVVHV